MIFLLTHFENLSKHAHNMNISIIISLLLLFIFVTKKKEKEKDKKRNGYIHDMISRGPGKKQNFRFPQNN